MSTWTRKHYERTADLLHAEGMKVSGFDRDLINFAQMVAAWADEFANDNPRFKVEVFLARAVPLFLDKEIRNLRADRLPACMKNNGWGRDA